MNFALRDDPLTYEVTSEQQADEYDAWFRAKVQEALNSDEKNAIPHDEVVARVALRRSEMLASLKMQFKTEQEAQDYTEWLITSVEQARHSEAVSHDEALAHFTAKRSDRMEKLKNTLHCAEADWKDGKLKAYSNLEEMMKDIQEFEE